MSNNQDLGEKIAALTDAIKALASSPKVGAEPVPAAPATAGPPPLGWWSRNFGYLFDRAGSDRPRSTRGQILAAFFAAFTAMAAVFATIVYVKAIRSEGLNYALDSLGTLYKLNASLSQKASTTPRVLKCLRDDPDGMSLKELNPSERNELQEESESLAAVFEYYFLVRGQISAHPNREDIVRSWDVTFKRACERSAGFRETIHRSPDVWTKSFMDEFRKHTGKS